MLRRFKLVKAWLNFISQFRWVRLLLSQLTTVWCLHATNVQLLLDARADPWRTTPIVSLCDHPWYWFGFLSRHESVNAVQVSFVQGPEDTVADLLPNDTQIQQSAGETAHPSTVSGRRLVQGLCLPTFIMDLLTRQQAQHHWFEADPLAEFDDLLEALRPLQGYFNGVRFESSRYISSGGLETPTRSPVTLIGTTMR